MASRTLLDDLELPLAQCIDVEDSQSLVRHAVPGLDGDFLQRMGRRAARVAVTGVVTGPESRDGLERLRDRLRGTEPVDFVADIATATRVSRVLVEELDVRELAGKPERFEYAFLLREYDPPPPPESEDPPPEPPPPLDTETGTLAVEVIVQAEPDFDMGRVSVTAEGPASGPSTLRTLTAREANRWTQAELPPGRYVVRAAVAAPAMSAQAEAVVSAGQTAQATLTLARAQGVARAFVVTFRFDSAFVEPCMRAVLRRAAAYASAHPSEHLVVLGHTDKAGPPEYNQSLSERRARAVFASLDFANDGDRAVGEWSAIRRSRTGLPSLGDSWAEREYQQMLQALGYYPGQIDGDHGPLTDEAVRAFRCRKGLPPGTRVDDDVWAALIRDYLADAPPTVPASAYLANCAGSRLEWLGAGEQQPLRNSESAHRPSRRVELLFVTDGQLPCTVPVPDTWGLPAPGRTAAEWCLGPGDRADRACFLTRGAPAPPKWTVEPAEPAIITVRGSILRETEANGVVTTAPAPNTRFVLIASDGEFKQSESSRGVPAAAVTAADGGFTFPGKRAGVYVVEVQAPVLTRLADDPGAPALGPTVCKALLTDAARMDVVILRDPLLREIRLPVIAHRMTALHPTTRAVRTCPDAANPAVTHPQRTARDEAAVRDLLAAANRIWGQGRVRFELRHTVAETFATAGVDACHVSEDERNGLFADLTSPGFVNLFLFGSVEATGEAGVHVRGQVLDGPGNVVRSFQCIGLGDRVLLQIIQNFPPISKTPTQEEAEVILAHELGHYLSLDHVTSGDTARRLMLPSEAPENRRLIRAEVDQARASENARDCGLVELTVTGAVQIGRAGHRFAAIRDAAAPPVVVDARVPAPMLAAPGSTFAMTGGQPGAGPTQRTVARTSVTRTEVIARWTPPAAAGGAPRETYAAIHVLDFDLAVDGAQALGNGRFAAGVSPGAAAVVRAEVFPALVAVPDDLAAWQGGEATDDPLRRRVPLDAVGETTVSATIAGVTRSVTIVVVQLEVTALATAAAPPLTFVRVGLWDNAFEAAGAVRNGATDLTNFVGQDTRRFHFRVRDPAGVGEVRIDWRTRFDDTTNDDVPASQVLSLLETAAGSHVFASRAVMVVTDDDDRDEATHSGLAAPHADAGVRARGASNHRLRRITVSPARPLASEVFAEYTPAGAAAPVATVRLPVFERAPNEQRRRVPVHVFVMRTAAGPPPVTVIPVDPASVLWTRDLRIMRESYARIGMMVETVVPAGTPPADVVTVRGDSVVLIDLPAGVTATGVTLAMRNTLGTTFPGDANTARVFYCSTLDVPGLRGITGTDASAAGAGRQGTCAIAADVETPYTAAHEVGHLLTNKAANGGHYVRSPVPAGNRLFTNQNLMRNGTSAAEGVNESKRLWDAADVDGVNEFTAMRGSRFTRPF